MLQAIVKVRGALEAEEANKKSCGRLAAQWARMDECLMTRCAAAADVHDAVADLKLGVTGDERYDKVDREGEKADVEEQEDAELGRGRFATTYRMRHSIDGRLCAVKVVHMKTAEENGMRADDVQREAQMLGRSAIKRDLSSHQKRPINSTKETYLRADARQDQPPEYRPLLWLPGCRDHEQSAQALVDRHGTGARRHAPCACFHSARGERYSEVGRAVGRRPCIPAPAGCVCI